MSKSRKSPTKPEGEASSTKGSEKLRDLEVKDAGEVQGGKVAIQDFHFVKMVDKASAKL